MQKDGKEVTDPQQVRQTFGRLHSTRNSQN